MQFLELFLSNEIFSKTIMKIPFSYHSLPFPNGETEPITPFNDVQLSRIMINL